MSDAKTETKANGSAQKGFKTKAHFKDEPKKVELGFLEEDDEFEEFETDDWNEADGAESDKETNLWEDNWDDDNVEDDFTLQLRYSN